LITGFSPYEGSFTVSGAAKTVEFEILYWDQPPEFLSIKDGEWWGDDTDIYDPYDRQGYIELFTKNNIITSEGSTLEGNEAIWVEFLYDDNPIAFPVYEDIEITANGEFYFEGQTQDGVHSVIISGAFIEPDDPENQLIYGYAFHTVYGERSMAFNWTAYHEDDWVILITEEVEFDGIDLEAPTLKRRTPIESDTIIKVEGSD